MIRKLADGKFRLYSRKKNPRTGKRRNLGTFPTRRAALAARTRDSVFQAALTSTSATIPVALSVVRHTEFFFAAIEDQRHDQILLIVEVPN